MRLRRFELVIIGVTLAFACFIGGYFTGRSVSAVNITPVVTSQNDALPSAGAQAPSPAAVADEPGQSVTVAPGSNEQAEASGEPEPDKAGAPRSGDGRININSASRNELMDLPGIGSTLSERIVDYRNKNGPFLKIDDIMNVSGIGEKRFEAIRDKITV